MIKLIGAVKRLHALPHLSWEPRAHLEWLTWSLVLKWMSAGMSLEMRARTSHEELLRKLSIRATLRASLLRLTQISFPTDYTGSCTELSPWGYFTICWDLCNDFFLWQGDEKAFDQIFSEANFKTFNFRIRAKMETYNVRLKEWKKKYCKAYCNSASSFFNASLRSRIYGAR